MKEDQRMAEGRDPRISTTDGNGVPYGDRLKRAREATGKSPQEVAALLGISFQEYDEWETYEAELNMAMKLGELSKLSSVLGIKTSLIFDDEIEGGAPLSPEQLCAKIKAYLDATGISTAQFEDRAGFVVEPSLRDPSEVLKWNVDCLRSVCAEIGSDWRLALP